MPKIPEYRSQTSAVASPTKIDARVSGGGAELQGVGQAIGQVGQAVKSIQDFNDNKKKLDWDRQARMNLELAQDKFLDPSKPNSMSTAFKDGWEGLIDKRIEEGADQVEIRNMREIGDLRHAEAISVERKHEIKYEFDKFNANKDSALKSVYAKGAQEAEIQSRLFTNMISSSPRLSSDPALQEAMRSEIFTEALRGEIDRLSADDKITVEKVQALRARVNDDKGPYKAKVNSERFGIANRTLNMLEKQAKNLAVEKQRLGFTSAINAYKVTGYNNELLTEYEIDQSYLSEQEKYLMKAELSKATQLATFVKDMNGDKSLGSLKTELEDERLNIKNLAGEEAVRASAAYSEKIKLFANKTKNLREDFVSELNKTDEAFSKIYNSRLDSADKFANFMDVVDQRAAQLGVPPKYATKQEAETFANMIDSALSTEGGVDNLRKVINTMESNYGRRSPFFLAQVAQETKIPSEVYTAILTPNKYLRDLYLEAAVSNLNDLKPKLPENYKAPTDQEIDKEFEPFLKTLGSDPNALARYADVKASMKKAHAVLVARGKNPELKDLASKTLVGHYTYIEGGVRVPKKDRKGNHINIDKVVRNKNMLWNLIDIDNVEPPASYGTDKKEAAKLYLDSIKREHRIVNHSDEGLKIIDENGRTIQIRKGKVVRPLVFPWEKINEDLSGVAKGHLFNLDKVGVGATTAEGKMLIIDGASEVKAMMNNLLDYFWSDKPEEEQGF